MKTLLGQFVYKDPDAFEDSKIKATSFYNKFENDTLTLLARRDDKRDARLIYDAKTRNGMRGSGYGMKYPVKDEYIPIGKYKANKTKLMGGQIQMRSNNNFQIHNLKTQNITKNIHDILLKLHKDESIKFNDVDKLTTEEKDQLYNIGKQLHITQLFDIPSTLKIQVDKLKDEFQFLRGSIVAGNNHPDLLRRFKIVLLKMKNNKLISLQEYNEVLNI